MNSEQDNLFKHCGNKLTRLNGSDLAVNMRALREQLLGLTQSSAVKPKTAIVRKPRQWERESQTQEEWDDVGNHHPKTSKSIQVKAFKQTKDGWFWFI
jgi:hypothetical protein